MGQQTDDRWTTKAPKGRERTKGGTAMRRRGGGQRRYVEWETNAHRRDDKETTLDERVNLKRCSTIVQVTARVTLRLEGFFKPHIQCFNAGLAAEKTGNWIYRYSHAETVSGTRR